MSIRVIRLGTGRVPGEGTRIGTVRRPPRGVRKDLIAARDFYDVWFPLLAPSVETMTAFRREMTDQAWRRFVRAYRREMARPEASHALDLLTTLSQATSFSVGCYCEDETRCHRSILRALLEERGAALVREGSTSRPR